MLMGLVITCCYTVLLHLELLHLKVLLFDELRVLLHEVSSFFLSLHTAMKPRKAVTIFQRRMVHQIFINDNLIN